ncbi:dnaJ homolog 1, mitochondrial-like [Trifolium pratense]|uniref:Uncharacterized protein n=1 Tax=Trifolium pratense TaxID=57577 RepID=A0ACB0JFK3_TRIPR|nr:dnaJ homolog 1, mitochondrial-like [Trifolium pratense]XP_045800170.1 dnaJ homolog 1, mitochondrial-like [Trifolium pratense]XP_045800171.1 dnaJ homolog 1, mitochondrial-like [Trifolium pratense]XP_045800172.1 dnaJ homolog 1, mitochondrial-like [Trifolium pratense]CAJ2643859.1 unnamed protein product [Trifolium pratense]
MKKKEDSDDPKIWGAVLFGLIGATAATLVFGQVRKTVEWFSLQVSRSQAWKGKSGSSYRTAFQEEAWRKHNKRMQEEYEEEMERVERIRRMQNVFNRERNKHKRGYESWREQNGTGQYHQHFEREDWYWKTDASYRDRRTNYRETPRESGNYALSHHYSVLGLDRFRKAPYSDAEIKSAFRTKAKEYHPDQNQDNKDVAEAKFKEVMSSFEAIKEERKNHNQ